MFIQWPLNKNRAKNGNDEARDTQPKVKGSRLLVSFFSITLFDAEKTADIIEKTINIEYLYYVYIKNANTDP